MGKLSTKAVRYGVRYYKMDGTPYTGPNAMMNWAKDFEEQDRIIGRTPLPGGGRVSTVWLGLDHNFIMGGPILIFETMVFSKLGEALDQQRYSTLKEARKGHKETVKRWTAKAKAK